MPEPRISMRSLLYHPVAAPPAYPVTAADAIMFDLEDAVHPDRKDEARAALIELLRAGRQGTSRVLVRVNEVTGDTGRADLEAILAAGVADEVILPMVRSHWDVVAAARIAEAVWARTGTASPGPVLWPQIETARAVQAADAIAAAPLVRGLQVGPADLGAELRVRSVARRPWDWPLELLYAKQRAVVAARAAGVMVLDGGHGQLGDEPGLRGHAAAAAQMGFDGMVVVAEEQLAVVTEEFSPSADEVAWARRVIEVATALERSGESVTEVDGEIVEAPHVRAAEDILARHGDVDEEAA